MTRIKVAINAVSAVAAFVAALLWWVSARRVVGPNYDGGPTGSQLVLVDSKGNEFDPAATLFAQSRWSAWAAIAAGVAAGCQGVAALLPDH